jgi:nitrite reductase (NADH) small subunit
MPVYEVCRVDQLVEGRGRPARAGDHYVAVFLDRGHVHVIENQCLHASSPLDGGAVLGRGSGKVQCPWHGWVYDLRTGRHLTVFGERRGVAVYPCHIEDGMVKVTIDGPAGGALPQAGVPVRD